MQSIHILVVSLSPVFLHAVTQLLHRDARIAEVWEAQTGQAAVEHVKEWRPDVVSRLGRLVVRARGTR